MRLEGIDLNLLLCLGHLLEEGSVSRAAKKMGVTQPTMSHRLTQLRELLGDELLVRAGRGMKLTPQAHAILPKVRAALAATRGVLAEPSVFDPSTATDVVKVSAADYEAITVLEPLVRHLAAVAPGMDVRITLAGVHSPGELGTGAIDLLLGPALDRTMSLSDEAHRVIQDLTSRTLFSDAWCCAFRRGHPRGEGPISLEELTRIPHILTAVLGGERGFFDNILLDHGVHRRVAVTTPSFTQSARMAACTDYLVILPRAFAQTQPTLHVHELPLTVPPAQVAMWWHPRSTGDPRHRWLRQTMQTLADQLGQP